MIMAVEKNNKTIDTEILAKAATIARGLAMDAVEASHSGHLGLPLGCAEMGAILFGNLLNYNPENPKWLNRDRFILSAGHGSMFLYAWLHLSGYAVSLEDIKQFREDHSKTPGHPESIETPGVECTTGPLGQGVSNAVGMAVAAKMAEARYNTKEHAIFNHRIICFCGDGDLQEGISWEATALAGLWGLDNLIMVYDSNDVTLDAAAAKTQADDVEKRFEAVGFEVQIVDGHDMEEFFEVYEKFRTSGNGKPKIIIAKTLIGKGISEVEGTFKAHGEAGMKFVAEARKKLGLPTERYFVSNEVKQFFEKRKQALVKNYKEWQKLFHAWEKSNSTLAMELQDATVYKVPADLLNKIPEFTTEKELATRDAGGVVLNAIAPNIPLVVSGSADLHGSTKNYINDGSKDFSKDNPKGRNFYFGIREHAMGGIINGMGYYGLYRPSGATFLVFSDYLRPTLRLAALSKLPIFHFFTHDSIGVGQDGPTHQPVEHVSSLRLIPDLHVIRPADPEEVVGALVAALSRTDGPTVLILSRQAVPHLKEIPVNDRRLGVFKGGYIAKKEEGELKQIIIATGSELQHALLAAKNLGSGIRVVSMPCTQLFDKQSEKYRESILPSSCKKRAAIEAGVTDLWYKYVGIDGVVVGVDKFGLSAPGDLIMKEYGISAENLVNQIKKKNKQ